MIYLIKSGTIEIRADIYKDDYLGISALGNSVSPSQAAVRTGSTSTEKNSIPNNK